MALGYDTRVRSYYSQAENPNPPQIDNAMMNISCYKVSDLIPTRDEILNNCQVIINGGTREFEENTIQFETDDFIYAITNDGNFNFIFVNKTGTLNFTYSGYSMSLEVPEGGEGIYYQRDLGAGVPEGRTIEFIIGGKLKQIDDKFISDEIARKSDLDNYFTKNDTYNRYQIDDRISSNLSGYYTKSEVYNKSEIDNKISNVTVDLSGYYTKGEVYNKSEVYNKTEVDNAIAAVDLSDYYSKNETYNKTEVNNAIAAIDLSNYYTKNEVYSKSEMNEITGILDEISNLIGE
jgi:hypothetical protein